MLLGTVIDGHETVAEVFPMRGVQVEVASKPERRSVNRFAGWQTNFTREDSEPWNTCRSDVSDVAERIEEERGSVVSGEEEVPQLEEVVEVEEVGAMTAGVRAALRSIDDWDLFVIFQRRANVMKSVPHCLKGPFRNVMKVLLEEIVEGRERNDGHPTGESVEGFHAKDVDSQTV